MYQVQQNGWSVENIFSFLLPYRDSLNLINAIHLVIEITVRELMGWVRNIVLIKCIFGSGKPGGGRDFGWEGKRAR